jgi:tetratricopeptide (TPR) repeat protein
MVHTSGAGASGYHKHPSDQGLRYRPNAGAGAGGGDAVGGSADAVEKRALLDCPPPAHGAGASGHVGFDPALPPPTCPTQPAYPIGGARTQGRQTLAAGQVVAPVENTGTIDVHVCTSKDLELALQRGNIRSIHFTQGPFNDADLAKVPGNVVELHASMWGCRFSNAAVNAFLKRSTQLTHLELPGPYLTDKAFKDVVLPKLRHLNVSGNTGITDATLCPRPSTKTPRKTADARSTHDIEFVDAALWLGRVAGSAMAKKMRGGSKSENQVTHRLNVNQLQVLDASQTGLTDMGKTILRTTFQAREAIFYDKSVYFLQLDIASTLGKSRQVAQASIAFRNNPNQEGKVFDAENKKAALSLIEEGLVMVQECLDRTYAPDDRKRIEFSNYLKDAGRLYQDLGIEDQAKECYRGAVTSMQGECTKPVAVSLHLSKLGQLHEEWGNAAQAEDCHQTAVTVLRGTSERAVLAGKLGDLADRQEAKGDVALALVSQQEAREIATELFQEDPTNEERKTTLQRSIQGVQRLEKLIVTAP